MSSNKALIFTLKGSPDYVDGSNFADADLRDLDEDTIVLSLEGSRVTDSGMALLKKLSRLRCLDLDSTRIGDAAIVHLAGIESLEELWLEDTRITDACIAQLRKIPRLSYVSLAYTNVSENALRDLRRSRPTLKVGL